MRLTKRNNSPNWFLEVQIDGRHYVRSTKTTHKPTAKKIAEGLYRSLQVEVAQGPSNDITLAHAIERYMAVRKGMASERSLRGASVGILRIISGKTLLGEITGKHLTDFVEQRRSEGCAAQTVKHGVMMICAVIKQARREGYTVATVEPPAVPIKANRLRYLSYEEERRLLAELDPFRTGRGIPGPDQRPSHILKELHDNHDLVIMLLDTGARYSEIAKLQWDQIDLQDKSIRLWRSKVGNESVIYMTTRVFDLLERRSANKNSPTHVFTNRNGGPRGHSCIAIRKAIRRAGLHNCTVHTLRHTHASRLIQNGLSIYEVRSVLGHTDIKTTMRYAHLENVDVTQRARNVIEALNNSASQPQV